MHMNQVDLYTIIAFRFDKFDQRPDMAAYYHRTHDLYPFLHNVNRA